jgi:oligo-1,6-glucosidase
VYGTYDLLLDEHQEICAFTRTLEDDRMLVILNFTKNKPVFAFPGLVSYSDKEPLISNYAVDPVEDFRVLALRPYEARVYRLRPRLPQRDFSLN